MPSLRITRFAGLRPRVSPHLLPDEYAQEAISTRLVDGAVGAQRGLQHVLDAGRVGTIYVLPDVGGTCQGVWTHMDCVSVVNVPAPGVFADLDHFVIFHPTLPPERFFPATNSYYPLIVPAPTQRLNVRKLTSTTLDTELYRGPDQTTWTYTWVDQFGVESPPAPPSMVVRRWDDETWELSGFASPPADAEYVRIYRAMPSFDDGRQVKNPFDTSFQLVKELEVSALTDPWIDDVRNKDIETGTLLTAWDQPPPTMEQVVGTESGYLFGFEGNDIWMSERHEPHHWPEKYRLNLPDRIVAMVANGDWVYVMTTGRPYRIKPEFIAQGEDETETRVDIAPYPDQLPALGRLATCWAPFGAMYVTTEGLVALSSDRARLITAERIQVDEWLDEWAPNIIQWWRGRLYAWRSPSTTGFVLDLPESGDALDPGDLYRIDFGVAPQVLHAGVDGWLYVSDGDKVYRLGRGAALPWRWRSKPYVSKAPVRYNVAKVRCDGTVTLRIYADGKRVFDQAMRHEQPVRIPPYPRAITYEIELLSDTGATVYDVHIATSLSELSEG